MSKSQSKKAIIDLLNEVLTAELTAINQYFLNAELCRHSGYAKLHAIARKESIDEMKHAQQIMERVLFLGGIPNVQRLSKINVGENVPEQFRLDVELEEDAIKRLKGGITLCQNEGDHGTAVLLQSILVSEEEHLDWLQTQLDVIEKIGEQNYLAQQIIAN
jgi:bacterioferritin